VALSLTVVGVIMLAAASSATARPPTVSLRLVLGKVDYTGLGPRQKGTLVPARRTLPAKACLNKRTVRVFRSDDPRDAGITHTRRDGSFKVQRPYSPGSTVFDIEAKTASFKRAGSRHKVRCAEVCREVLDSIFGPGSGHPSPVSYVGLDPGFKDFGNVMVGASSAPATFTVTNVSSQPRGPLALSLSPNSTEFLVSNDLCTGTVLAVAGQCTFDIRFSPMSTGSRYTFLGVNSPSGAESFQGALLEGTGTP
jgi:hypothetical protein